MKFKKPRGDTWESLALFKISVAVIVPRKGFQLPGIFGMELNGVQRCPLCGRKLEENFQSASRISGGQESTAVSWPFHAMLYEITSKSLKYRCGGSLFRINAVLTAGKIANSFANNNPSF